MRTVITSFFFFISFPPFLLAQNEPEQLYSLSFEELLDVTITLASKTEETIKTVPSSTAIFSYEQIRNLGISNVYELMNFVPGFQSTRGDWVGAVPKEHTRGIYLDTGHVLVMVDGQRLNESSFGKASVYSPYIPVEVVDKVEFIRGPGSALYGSNAFLGVVNIVTNKEKKRLSVGIGENGYHDFALSQSGKSANSISWHTNLMYMKDDGRDYFSGIISDPIKSLWIDGGVTFNSFKLQARYNHTYLDDFLNLGRFSKRNEHYSENWATMMEYAWQFGQLELSSKLSFAHHEIKSAGLILTGEELGLFADEDFLLGPYWGSEDFNLNLDAAYQYNQNTTYHFGLEYSEEKQNKAGVVSSYFNQGLGVISFQPSSYIGSNQSFSKFSQFESLLKDFDSHALYAQVKHIINDQFTVFLGGRFDEVKGIDKKFSPRGAVIYQLNNSHTLKLQYGESFRTPVSNEIYSNDSVTVGNPELKSEYVKTTEVVWQSNFETANFELVVFDNELEDFVNIVPLDSRSTRYTFENGFETSIQGIELKTHLKLSKMTEFDLSYTQFIDEPINPSFKKFASFNMMHQIGSFKLGANFIWRDSVRVDPLPELSALGMPSFLQKNYFIFGGSIEWAFNKQHSVTLKGRNLTNRSFNVFDPRLIDGEVPGKQRELTLHYKWAF